MARASLDWEKYIKDIHCHDKGWFKDILVVGGPWEGDISRLQIQSPPPTNPYFKDDLSDIGVYSPDMIRRAMQIPAIYRNWK